MASFSRPFSWKPRAEQSQLVVDYAIPQAQLTASSTNDRLGELLEFAAVVRPS